MSLTLNDIKTTWYNFASLLNNYLMVLILSCGGHCINFFLKCPFVFCVVLWSPRTLFVKSTLHERPLYWTLYCGDMFKIACLWIQGKITASISSSAFWKYKASIELVQQNIPIILLQMSWICSAGCCFIWNKVALLYPVYLIFLLLYQLQQPHQHENDFNKISHSYL